MPDRVVQDRATAVMINYLLERNVRACSRTRPGMPAPRSRITRRRRESRRRSRAGGGAARQDRADRRLGRARRQGAGTRQGRRRQGPRDRGGDLLREPQLATLLHRRNADPRLRDLEQLGFRAPDNIVVPLGYGSNILGCERGFAR